VVYPSTLPETGLKNKDGEVGEEKVNKPSPYCGAKIG